MLIETVFAATSSVLSSPDCVDETPSQPDPEGSRLTPARNAVEPWEFGPYLVNILEEATFGSFSSARITVLREQGFHKVTLVERVEYPRADLHVNYFYSCAV